MKKEPYVSTHSILFNNRRYDYMITYQDEEMCFFECQAANIAQYYPSEDLATLLKELPELIITEQNYRKDAQNLRLQIRVTKEEKDAIEKKAHRAGFRNISTFMRDIALQ